MNSRKNPLRVRPVSSSSVGFGCALFAAITLSACSSLSRSDGESPNRPDAGAGKFEGRDARFSANEGADDSEADPKDRKIRSLESTVSTLNGRIAELESKLQANQNRPAIADRPAPALPSRQDPVAPAASVAASDPGAGYVNDAKVRAFRQAKALFDQEKYPESILAFSAFLEGAQRHSLAGSAQYYIAESYYLQGDFAVADQEFQKLALRYPNSSRMSWALIRLAEVAERLGKTDEARRYRMQAEAYFAKSPAIRSAGRSPSQPAVRAETTQAQAPAARAEETGTLIETAPSMSIERPVAPTAPRVDAGSDLDAPPGAN
jgi:TolA-binding protein